MKCLSLDCFFNSIHDVLHTYFQILKKVEVIMKNHFDNQNLFLRDRSMFTASVAVSGGGGNKRVDSLGIECFPLCTGDLTTFLSFIWAGHSK